MAPFLSNDERNMATRDAREFLRGAIPPTARGGEPQPQSGKGRMMSPGPDRNVMALEAIHPASLEKLFQFFERFNQPARNWPIPRQYGGYADPKEEYLVGEKGPEVFKPNVPGTVVPADTGYDPYLAARQVFAPPEPTTGPQTFKEGSLYQNVLAPAGRFFGGIAESRRRAVGLPQETTPSWERDLAIPMVQGPTGTYEVPMAGGTIPEGGRAAPWPGPSPWQDINRELLPSHAPTTGFATPTPGRNWEDMGQGIFGGFPTAKQGQSVADEMAVERYNKEVTDAQRRQAAYDSYLADRELGQAAGVIPRTGMAEYEYNAARMRMTPKERLLAVKERGELGKEYLAGRRAADVANLEHGWESPASQERLARAYNLREMPGVERERTAEYAQSRIDVARENAIQRREAATSKIEQQKIDRELKLYDRTLGYYKTKKTDIDGNITESIDVIAATPEIEKLIRGGKLSEDFRITLPETKEMNTMPDAVSNKGRIIRDTVSGKRLKSDGKVWNEVK